MTFDVLNDDDDQWMTGISQEWAEELSDARQDIYTLDDGEPVDEFEQ